MWHAYASREQLHCGTDLLVTGGALSVQLHVGARLSIELPNGQRIQAVVILHEEHRMVLAIMDSDHVELRRTCGDWAFADFKLSDGFSREIWTVR